MCKLDKLQAGEALLQVESHTLMRYIHRVLCSVNNTEFPHIHEIERDKGMYIHHNTTRGVWVNFNESNKPDLEIIHISNMVEYYKEPMRILKWYDLPFFNLLKI